MRVSGPLRPVTADRPGLRPAGAGILLVMPTVMSPAEVSSAEPAPADRTAEPAVPQLATLGRPRRARRDRSRWLGARQALSFAMGIASVFDLTGTTVYRSMRSVLPPAPPRAEEEADPFRSAMGTILSAHRDAMASADNDDTDHGAALPG
jgi:hypothetical protein